jgi:hypothetical protein
MWRRPLTGARSSTPQAPGHCHLQVRELVQTRLAVGAADIGLSRSWVDDAVAELPAGKRAVAKLALLTALASYQVDADVVASARRECADDAAY